MGCRIEGTCQRDIDSSFISVEEPNQLACIIAFVEFLVLRFAEEIEEVNQV